MSKLRPTLILIDTIKDRASIHDRPKTIESRGEAGHWEGDCEFRGNPAGDSDLMSATVPI